MLLNDSMLLSDEELQRYQRQIMLPNVGLNGQRRLKKAKVLCIGAGGLGSPALLYLAAAGIGTLGIVDNDKIEITNLQRQILYSIETLHHSKVDIAAKKLNQINSHVNVETYPVRLNASNAEAIITNYDLVIDGSDNFATRYLVNDYCVQLGKPFIFASIWQSSGQCAVFNYQQGPCYRCLFPETSAACALPNCNDAGVVGTTAGILGLMQTNEAIKLILKTGELLAGQLLTINLLTMDFKKYHISKNPECICKNSLNSKETNIMENTLKTITVKELQQLQQQNADFVLLDVREPYEYAICNLNGINIPLKDLLLHLERFDKNKLVITHCKMGPRSFQAAEILMAAGYNNVKVLEGGIYEWIKEIDPTMPMY